MTWFSITPPRHQQSWGVQRRLEQGRRAGATSISHIPKATTVPRGLQCGGPGSLHHWRNQWPVQTLRTSCRLHGFSFHLSSCLLMQAAWVPCCSHPYHDEYWGIGHFFSHLFILIISPLLFQPIWDLSDLSLSTTSTAYIGYQVFTEVRIPWTKISFPDVPGAHSLWGLRLNVIAGTQGVNFSCTWNPQTFHSYAQQKRKFFVVCRKSLCIPWRLFSFHWALFSSVSLSFRKQKSRI